MVFNTGPYTVLRDNSIILITANMQSETGFPSSHQLKSYVASKSRLKLAARAVLSADAGLLVFPIVDTCLNCEDIARQICAIVPRWRFFGEFLCPAFLASRVQHVSDLHLKFALRPQHVWKYGRHPVCDG